jgi:hypothetical protein
MICAELLGRRGEVLARMRVAHWPLRVGRALDNDIVVDDPHVAAHHFEIAADGERLLVRDRGSLNGVWLDGRRLDDAPVTPGARLDFGHSHLRLRRPDEPVAPERPLDRSRLGRLPVVSALGGASLALLVLGLYAMTSEAVDWAQLGLAVGAVSGVVLAWAGGWALLGRLLAGRAQYARHLGIVLCAFLATELASLASDYAAFGLAWPALAAHGQYLYAAAFGWLFWQHLAANHAAPRVRAGVAAATIAAVIGTSWLVQRAGNIDGEQATVATADLSLPLVRLKPAVTTDQFFASVAELEAQLLERLESPQRRRASGVAASGG